MNDSSTMSIPGPATAAMDAPGLAASLFHYYGILRRGWRLVAIAVAVCLGSAAVFLARTSPLYAATARVLVLQRGNHPLSTAKEEMIQAQDGSETFLPTQMAILQSPSVVGRAIESIGPRNLPTLWSARRSETLADLTRVATKNFLRVARPDRTALIISIEYRAESADEATRMVSAIVASYERFLEDHMQSTNSELVSLISRARDELSRELEATQAKYVKFQRSHPLLLEDEPSRVLMNSRLIELDRAANESLVKAMRLRSQLESGRKLAREGTEMWAVAYAISQLGGDPGNGLIPRRSDASGMASEYLRKLEQEKQELAARFGPDYSKVKELQEQISSLQGGAGEPIGRADDREVRQLLASIEQSLESVEAQRAEIARQVQVDLEKAKKTADDLSAGRGLRDSLERLKVLFYTVVDQLKRVQLGGDFSRVYSRTVEPTNASSKPVYPRVSITLAMALVIGCVLGAGAALVADSLDVRVRSPDDLRAILGLRVLGVIPRPEWGPTGVIGELGLICLAHPQSPSAEAYKGIRTGIEFLRRDRSLQVILVTSAVASEGKSTTSSNLAISLAQAGRKVLLVDADLRNPTLHRVFGLRRDSGLVHILKELLPLHRVVQRTSIRDLDLVASGPDVLNQSELLMSPCFTTLIQEARASYDVVIVDSSPLLSVTDATIIGSMVDGIVLVARASVIRRPDATRAIDLLHAVETPILGAVIHEPEADRVAGGEDRGLFQRAATTDLRGLVPQSIREWACSSIRRVTSGIFS